MKIPAHIAIDESAGSAACTVCKVSLMPGGDFGMIPRSNLVASFVIDHATHDKHNSPSGLTPTGRATKAARAALAGHPEGA